MSGIFIILAGHARETCVIAHLRCKDHSLCSPFTTLATKSLQAMAVCRSRTVAGPRQTARTAQDTRMSSRVSLRSSMATRAAVLPPMECPVHEAEQARD